MRDLCAFAIVLSSWTLIAFGSGPQQSDWRVLVGAALAGIGLLVVRQPRRFTTTTPDLDDDGHA
jgi:hypothetical protein